MRSKIVEFKKIKVRNFLSYGDDPIEISFNDGITFVTGYNKDNDSFNGVGKTSLIVESLSFLLFGETYRDITQKLIRNKDSTGTCIVEGWLKVNDDEIHIARSISPNKLILTVNGNSVDYTKSIPETNKDIAERIGISKTVFTNTIVMTNRDSMSFLNQKKDAKVKFIEGILGLEAFEQFFKLSKEHLKKIDTDRSSKFQEVTLLERDLANDRSYQKQHQDKIMFRMQDTIAKISELELRKPVDYTDEIINLQKDVQDKLSEISLKDNKIKNATEKTIKLESELSYEMKNLAQLSGKLASCPSCKRPYENHDHEQIENEKKVINDRIVSCREKISNFKSAISKVQLDVNVEKTIIRNYTDDINRKQREQSLFEVNAQSIKTLQNELMKYQIDENPFDDKILKSELNIDVQRNNLTDFIRLSKLANIVKEAASPTGIKSIVIKKIIGALNSRINFYLMRLHSPYRVTFDEFFEESFQTDTGKEYSYGSLSGGEAKRVDFAMLFAFRDIRRLQSNVHINVTVMDELFDSALCQRGMSDILDILRETTDECYMIVTHKFQNVESSGCEIINLVKENGITRISDSETLYQ